MRLDADKTKLIERDKAAKLMDISENIKFDCHSLIGISKRSGFLVSKEIGKLCIFVS